MPANAIIVVIGCCLAFYGNQLPDADWMPFLPLLLWLARFNKPYRLLLLLAASYLWAAALLHYHLEFRLNSSFDQKISLISGEIIDIPRHRDEMIRLSLKPDKIETYPDPLPRRILLNWYQTELLPAAGERWQFEVKLRQPRGFLNPAGFDFEAWQFVKGIDARGYIRNSLHNRRLSRARFWSIDRWRAELANAIGVHCINCSNSGVIKALVLGYRGDINPLQSQILRDTGTAHLIAISGLHIGLIAGLFYFFGHSLWNFGVHPGSVSRQVYAATFAILAAVFYSALAGFSVSTLRALLMLSVLFAAVLFRKRLNLLQSVSLALAVMLLLDPRLIQSTGFWLSISAVLLIAYIRFRFPQASGWRQWFFLQVGFALIFMPMGILIFDQVNPAALLANLIAIPVISFVVLPLALGSSLLALTGIKWAANPLKLCDRILEYLMQYLDQLLGLGLDSISAAQWPPALLMLFMIFLLSISLPMGCRHYPYPLLLLLILLLWQPKPLSYGDYEMVVFDVGMGTSVLLRTRNHSLVYDFGPGNSRGFSAAEYGLIPYLKRHAIRSPDMLVVSHVDQDHSGGFISFVEEHSAPSLLSGTPQALKARFALDHDVLSCHEYPDWTWDGVRFRFFKLNLNLADSSNNRSCVLKISSNHSVLLPGDIEARQEQQLLQKYASALASEILLVPHHGSETSSSPPFINQIAPDNVIYTLSRGNRWGFPRNAVVKRFERQGSRQYRTDRDGAIRLKSTSSGLKIETLKGSPKRIWRRW